MVMTLSQLVFRSMKKNIKHYYLYFFALIFSVTLYFSFVTLQYNPSIVEISVGVKVTAGLRAASYLLLFVVVFFVLYANRLFMKRRSKEIGLYQLIGMSKSLVTRLLALENTILWIGALSLGVIIGFLTSRIFAMILLKVLEKDVLVDLTFSVEALQMTVLVFLVLLIVVLIQTTFTIRRVSLITLFHSTAIAEEKIKKFSGFQMFLGLLGLLMIGYGYYLSTSLFEVYSENANMLLIKMLSILGSTIFGTFLVFRFSVAFLMNLARKRKKGHLSIEDVLSLTPIMHRMKANAMSLTTITVISATALAILCLSYISYYSAGSMAERNVPFDFILLNEHGEAFLEELDNKGISYNKTEIDLLNAEVETAELYEAGIPAGMEMNTKGFYQLLKLSDAQKMWPQLSLEEGEGYVSGYSSMMSEIVKIESDKPVSITTSKGDISLHIKEVKEESPLVYKLTGAGVSFIVTDQQFEQLAKDSIIGQNTIWEKQVGINIKDSSNQKEAQSIYESTTNDGYNEAANSDGYSEHFQVDSQEMYRASTLDMFGLVIFITGFLGLAFLVTTGSILYFKQMSEADEERESYTILRKIGFTTNELMRGIYRKQLFNFGFPLIIGLAHSYFAVKSGWMLFGTELVAPLLITMGVYIILYSVFAVLTVGYYKKVVNESL